MIDGSESISVRLDIGLESISWRGLDFARDGVFGFFSFFRRFSFFRKSFVRVSFRSGLEVWF